MHSHQDIGFQGMLYASPNSSYVGRLASFLAKKKRLAVDGWGADASVVQSLFDPIDNWLSTEAPHFSQKYPPTWTVDHWGEHITQGQDTTEG
jgi:hypothetical protein